MNAKAHTKETHMPRSSGTPLYRFVKKLGALFGVTPGSDGAGMKAYEGEASATPRSVDKAAKSSGKRAAKARKVKASKSSNSRKPPARKIAQHAGAGMANTGKADKKGRARTASRARQASGRA